tara:strand:+ start:1451 stop:2713 length:1263 start_codon:yes stop_codon:yes gene_type:complete
MEKSDNTSTQVEDIEKGHQFGQMDFGLDDDLWKARTGLDEDSLCGAIETIIYMSERPISLQKIKNLIDEDLPLRLIHKSINKLQEDYELPSKGIRIIEVAEGYQFRTKPIFSKYIQNLYKVNSLMLTPTALEVLAIIAYKQPVSRTEVEKIRGVDSSHIVRGLMDKRLVRVSGRSSELGKPITYSTTQEFLEVFNLPDISSLPPESELEAMTTLNEVGTFEDFKNLVSSSAQSFNEDDLKEIEDLSKQIKSIHADTFFTKSLRLQDKKRSNNLTGEHVEVKSSFDLLEEYILKEEISSQNILAAQSELINASLVPEVVRDLTQGPFNVPDIDDSAFAMIDLDTGEEILEDLEVISNLKKEDPTDQEKESRDNENSFDELFLSEAEGKINELTDKVAKEGSDLDLDLEFLNEEPIREDTEK